MFFRSAGGVLGKVRGGEKGEVVGGGAGHLSPPGGDEPQPWPPPYPSGCLTAAAPADREEPAQPAGAEFPSQRLRWAQAVSWCITSLPSRGMLAFAGKSCVKGVGYLLPSTEAQVGSQGRGGGQPGERGQPVDC